MNMYIAILLKLMKDVEFIAIITELLYMRDDFVCYLWSPGHPTATI